MIFTHFNFYFLKEGVVGCYILQSTLERKSNCRSDNHLKYTHYRLFICMLINDNIYKSIKVFI